jgi:hypothetical protein
VKRDSALLFSAVLFLAACGGKHEGGGASSASASAKVPAPKPTVTATAAATASATASAAPTASATAAPSGSADEEAAPSGPVHIHMDAVKVTSGKSDGAEKTLKANMLKLRTACVAPAIKKTPSFEGTLRVTLDVGADGKIGSAKGKTTAGKLPDDLVSCVEKFYADKIQLEASKATVDATILMGPKVHTK